MVANLFKILKGIGIEPTAEGLSDMLWLAKHLDKPILLDDIHLLDKSGCKKDCEKENGDIEQINKSGKADENVPKTDTTLAPKANLYPPNSESKIEGLPFQAPGGTPLPGKLEISRALRPLMRKVPSGSLKVFDEKNTVHKISESEIWTPVFKPKFSQWFDVILLFDESPSMIIWYQTVLEFKELLERQGAFRNVQMWGFCYDGKNKAIILHTVVDFNATQQISRAPKELIDPRGRRLILIVSDCISSVWHSNDMYNMLKVWEKNSRMALVQLLPFYLWNRTGLANTEHVYFRSSGSNAMNFEFEIAPSPMPPEKKMEKGIKLPVVTLEKRSLFPWAQCIMGKSGIWIPGIILTNSNVTPKDQDEDEIDLSKLSPEKHLNLFRATASPEAQDLARLLAAIPLELPIIRLVQEVFLPNTKQIHLSEIILSGLIESKNGQSTSSSQKEIAFEFKEGIRNLLNKITPIKETIATLSLYIEKYLGAPISFKALVASPARVEEVFKEKNCYQFAQITTKVLKNLGGKYKRLADQIEQKNREWNIYSADKVRITTKTSRRTNTQQIRSG